MYFDAHNHLHAPSLAPHLGALLRELPAHGIAGMVTNGTSEADWPALATLAATAPWVRPAYGLHPWYAGNRSSDWETRLQADLAAAPGAAVGEIGLDRWMLERARPDDPRLAGLRRAPLDEQLDVFHRQLALAAAQNRAACLHCLDAWGALQEALRTARRPARGFLLHAYAGPAEMVEAFAELGAYFSFNAAFLAPGRQRVRDAFLRVPAERLLVETDAPDMGPPPGMAHHTLPPSATGETVHHPACLIDAYTGLAALRGLTPAALVPQIAENFRRLFG